MTQTIIDYIQKSWILTIYFNRNIGRFTINCGIHLVSGSTVDEALNNLNEEILKNNNLTA